MLTTDEASVLKWQESLYFICTFNFFIQPIFMIARYRRLPSESKKAFIPAIVLVPLFNFALLQYTGNRMQKKYQSSIDKYIGHLKDPELLNFDTLYAQLKE